MARATEDGQLGDRMHRLEQLLQECEAATDSPWKAKTREIVETLLDFHGAGLTTIVACLQDAGLPGAELLRAIDRDEAAHNLLLLYGLHPQDLHSRVGVAVTQLRPMLAGHGGDVELLECSDTGIVRLRLSGNCHGCPSSQMTLKHLIEETLYAATPDIAELHVEGVAESEPAPDRTSGFVPVAALAPAVQAASPETDSVEARST